MTVECGRADCPVPDPTDIDLRGLRSVVLERGSLLWRGLRREHPPTQFVPGLGNTRFAPLDGHHHVYVSRTATAALLESALHHVSGPDPTIWRSELAAWQLASIHTRRDLRLVDLRDEQLQRLGLDRTMLVDTLPLHYRCTRRFARALAGRAIGGQQTAGLVWHSRQADLHARAHADGLLGDLLTHRSVEVAVLFHPPAPRTVLGLPDEPRPLLLPDGLIDPLIVELSALIGAPIE